MILLKALDHVTLLRILNWLPISLRVKTIVFRSPFYMETPPPPRPTLPCSDLFTTLFPLAYFTLLQAHCPSCRPFDKPGILPSLDLCISSFLYLEFSAFSFLQGKYLISLLKCYLHESYPDEPINKAAFPPCTLDLPSPAFSFLFLTFIF